jgi:uncharacterized protein
MSSGETQDTPSQKDKDGCLPRSHDVDVRHSVIHGLGVFATRDFDTNQTILLIDDSRVVDAAHLLRPEVSEYPRHYDYLAGGTVVLMPAPERYINACCDPNACVCWMSGRRHVVARRAIAAGEEITYDYLVDCQEARCGSADVAPHGVDTRSSRASSNSPLRCGGNTFHY